MAELVWLHS